MNPGTDNELEVDQVHGVNQGPGLVLWMFWIFTGAGCFAFGYASGVFGWV